MCLIALILVLEILDWKRIEMLNINKDSIYMYRKVLMGVMVSREGRQAHMFFIALFSPTDSRKREERRDAQHK